MKSNSTVLPDRHIEPNDKYVGRNYPVPSCVPQDVIHTQERSIAELLKAVKEQSDQLVHQRSKIKTLEEKVVAAIVQQSM